MFEGYEKETGMYVRPRTESVECGGENCHCARRRVDWVNARSVSLEPSTARIGRIPERGNPKSITKG